MSKKKPLEEGWSLAKNDHKWRIYTCETESLCEFLPPDKLTIYLIFFSLGDSTHIVNITIQHWEPHAPEA